MTHLEKTGAWFGFLHWAWHCSLRSREDRGLEEGCMPCKTVNRPSSSTKRIHKRLREPHGSSWSLEASAGAVPGFVSPAAGPP